MALDELGDATYTEIRNWALSNLYRIRHKHSLLEPAAVGRRLSEMERAGMIEKTGKQRVTPSLRKANVYRIKKQTIN
jgi:hypothetical protein